MSSEYRKIKYQEEGAYGSIVEKYIYVWSHNTSDIMVFFDDNFNYLFSYAETSFNMGDAISIAVNWDDDKMQILTAEEINKITQAITKSK